MRALAVLLAGGQAASAAMAAACGDGLGSRARRIDGADWQLVYRTAPDPVPVGRHFAIDFVLCPRGTVAAPSEVRVDATMPEHRHGMNYQPSVSARAGGQYRAEGLMFHMPGRWELVFELRSEGGGAPLRLAQTLQIE